MKEIYRPLRASISFNLEDRCQEKKLQEMLKLTDYQLILWELVTQNHDLKEELYRVVDEVLEEHSLEVDDFGRSKFHSICGDVVCRIVRKLADESQLNFED